MVFSCFRVLLQVGDGLVQGEPCVEPQLVQRWTDRAVRSDEAEAAFGVDADQEGPAEEVALEPDRVEAGRIDGRVPTGCEAAGGRQLDAVGPVSGGGHGRPPDALPSGQMSGTRGRSVRWSQ